MIELIEARIAAMAGRPTGHFSPEARQAARDNEVAFLDCLLAEAEVQPTWEELDSQCVINSGMRLGIVNKGRVFGMEPRVEFDVPDPYGDVIRQLKEKFRERRRQSKGLDSQSP